MVTSAGTRQPDARRSQACRRTCPAHARRRGAPAASHPSSAQPTMNVVEWVCEVGGKILSFFSPLPQNILVPPTPATGRRFPLLWVRIHLKEKMIIFWCLRHLPQAAVSRYLGKDSFEGKNDNFVLFFLTRARAASAATPRALVSAALTGDRLRAETEAAPVQRGHMREAASSV